MEVGSLQRLASMGSSFLDEEDERAVRRREGEDVASMGSSVLDEEDIVATLAAIARLSELQWGPRFSAV